MADEVRRIKRELVHKGAVLDIYCDTMQFENGNTAKWDFIHHDGAAAVVPVMDDGRLLMVRQYRNALESIHWSFRLASSMTRKRKGLYVLPENWKRRLGIVQISWNG